MFSLNRKSQSSKSTVPMASKSDASHTQAEAPPAYSFGSSSSSTDPLAALSQYDTIFLVDDSGSMMEQLDIRVREGPTRWDMAMQTLINYARISSKYDTDGIDVHFLNNTHPRVRNTNLVDEESITKLFRDVQANGLTPIGARLKKLTSDYRKVLKNMRKGERPPKPRNYIIITDGEPSDRVILDKFLLNVGKLLRKKETPGNQIGFQFVQIGDDPFATRYLENLDDRRPSDTYDIVDTVKSDPNGSADPVALIEKVLLGAVNRFLDNQALPQAKRHR